MTAIITAVTSIVNAFSSTVSQWVSVITSEGNELLLFFMLIPFLGLGIGLLKRLLRL